MSRLAVALGIAVALSAGCRKPEVEIEEESPPLPEPEPGSDQWTDVPAVVSDTLPLPLATACKMMDVHLRGAGVETFGRSCDALREEGATLRLNLYLVPGKPARNYNGCFWKRDDGPGFALGYLDRVNRPCVDQDTYCRMGARGALVELSYTACPGERDHLLPGGDAAAALARLAGDWVGGSGGTASFKATGEATIARGGQPITGAAHVRSTAVLEVTDAAKNVTTPFGYALDGDRLWISRGLVVPAADPEVFVIPLSEHLRIRRYGGGCFAASDKPGEAPVAATCTISGQGDAAQLEVILPEGRSLRLYRRAGFWMDLETQGNELKRVTR